MAGKIDFDGLFKQLGYTYPSDAFSPPPGVEEYCFLEHVRSAPARDAAGVALPNGIPKTAQQFLGPPNSLLIIRGLLPLPKNRTAVESSYVHYRGVLETRGRSLFCAPGVGSDKREGTLIGIGNLIILPKGKLEVVLWNTDPCSEAKWTLRWNSYLLEARY